MPLGALTFDQCQNSPQTPPRVLTMLFGRGCAGQFPSVVANNFVILKADRKLLRQIQGKNRWILWVALPEIIDSKETTPRAFQKKRLHCEGCVREQPQQESNFLIGAVDRGKCLCATVGNPKYPLSDRGKCLCATVGNPKYPLSTLPIKNLDFLADAVGSINVRPVPKFSPDPS